jgi:site-specific DNA-methyltransferase (adenine-specific)
LFGQSDLTLRARCALATLLGILTSEVTEKSKWASNVLRVNKVHRIIPDKVLDPSEPQIKRNIPTSTVGRGKRVHLESCPTTSTWSGEHITVACADSLNLYETWPTPTTIVSDGAYGVLGFEGDTSDHLDIPIWYEPHVQAWSKAATPQTTLWFWNSEIGWAAAHPVLEKYGWRYVNANIWNKGKGHIAGNVNTQKIRRFPVVSEVCVQYVFEARIDGLLLKNWLYREWKRSKLPMRKANDACGVKDAAVRKYLDQGHLWYYPPAEMFERMQIYANEHGDPTGRPYFSVDGKNPLTGMEWLRFRSKFSCPHGVTNVWERNALRGKERFKVNGSNGKAVHLNQKPLDLMTQIIEASTERGDVIWEPFGGLFSASVAAGRIGRQAYGAEIDPAYFHHGCERLNEESRRYPLL